MATSSSTAVSATDVNVRMAGLPERRVVEKVRRVCAPPAGLSSRMSARAAEIRARDVLVPEQVGGAALQHDAALLEDVGAVGDGQRGLGELLDDQQREALVAQRGQRV